MLQAIINERFKTGPGSNKIKAGEYELLNTVDHSLLVVSELDHELLPGMSITMTIIIGRYGIECLDQCPRVECKSSNIQNGPRDAKVW